MGKHWFVLGRGNCAFSVCLKHVKIVFAIDKKTYCCLKHHGNSRRFYPSPLQDRVTCIMQLTLLLLTIHYTIMTVRELLTAYIIAGSPHKRFEHVQDYCSLKGILYSTHTFCTSCILTMSFLLNTPIDITSGNCRHLNSG